MLKNRKMPPHSDYDKWINMSLKLYEEDFTCKAQLKNIVTFTKTVVPETPVKKFETRDRIPTTTPLLFLLSGGNYNSYHRHLLLLKPYTRALRENQNSKLKLTTMRRLTMPYRRVVEISGGRISVNKRVRISRLLFTTGCF